MEELDPLGDSPELPVFRHFYRWRNSLIQGGPMYSPSSCDFFTPFLLLPAKMCRDRNRPPPLPGHGELFLLRDPFYQATETDPLPLPVILYFSPPKLVEFPSSQLLPSLKGLFFPATFRVWIGASFNSPFFPRIPFLSPEHELLPLLNRAAWFFNEPPLFCPSMEAEYTISSPPPRRKAFPSLPPFRRISTTFLSPPNTFNAQPRKNLGSTSAQIFLFLPS